MKSKEEITELANKIFPYDPYDNQFFPGTRQAKISGFVAGYLKAQEEILNIDNSSAKSENSVDKDSSEK